MNLKPIKSSLFFALFSAKHGTIVYDKKFSCKGEDFDDACGAHDFIQHENLFKKESHIPDQKLTISCEVNLEFFD